MRVNDALATWVFATLVAIELATLLRPRDAARATRWLSAAAVALLVACAVPWLGAIPTRFAVPVDRIPHAIEAQRVDHPTTSELASLRGSSLPVSCGTARRYSAYDPSYGGVRPSSQTVQCGLVPFQSTAVSVDDSRAVEWRSFGEWRCSGGDASCPRALFSRSSPDGTFLEYVCQDTRWPGGPPNPIVGGSHCDSERDHGLDQGDGAEHEPLYVRLRPRYGERRRLLPHGLALRASMLVGSSVGLASLAMIWLWRTRRRFALSTTATLVASPYRAADVMAATDAGERRHRVWLCALIVVAGGLFAASVECAGRVSGVWR